MGKSNGKNYSFLEGLFGIVETRNVLPLDIGLFGDNRRAQGIPQLLGFRILLVVILGIFVIAAFIPALFFPRRCSPAALCNNFFGLVLLVDKVFELFGTIQIFRKFLTNRLFDALVLLVCFFQSMLSNSSEFPSLDSKISKTVTLTLHGRHKILQCILIQLISLFVVLLRVLLRRPLDNLDRFLSIPQKMFRILRTKTSI